MATTSSLIKSLLHKTIAEGVYKEILSNTSRYYYFLGTTVKWTDETSPPYPTDDIKYEHDVRNNIITLKQIRSNDVAFIVKRHDWTYNTVYDIYDDQYSTRVIGVNIISGGGNYLISPTVTFSAPNISGGVQATGLVGTQGNQVVTVIMTNTGSGYTIPPTVTITDASGAGSGAVGYAVLGSSSTGKFSIEESLFYVITDEYNVYKCLDNNNGGKSTIKPIGTQVLPISLSDNYVWKYMFNVPIALRTKFLNDDYFPVVTALSQQYYSNGGIEFVKIDSRGTGYTSMSLTVDGDGYLESDPVFLNNISTTVRGYGYSDGDTVAFSAPYTSSSTWTANTPVYLGNIIASSTGKLYKITQAGTTGITEPSFRSGTVSDGTAALTFVGETVKAYPDWNTTTLSTVLPSGTAGQFTCAAAKITVGDTISITGTPASQPTLSGVAIGSGGAFTCTSASPSTLAVGQKLTISGTQTGTGTISGYSVSVAYYIIATNGTTTFTLSATAGGAAITTTAGTSVGLTYTRDVITGYTTGNLYKVSTITGTSPSVTGFTLTTTAGTAIVTTPSTAVTGLTYYDGAVNVIYPVGGVKDVTLNSFGSGYTSNPTINFTAPKITFTASASFVNTTSEVITIGSHWYATGDKIRYSTGGGTVIGGLVNNTDYYIIKSSSTSIKLATTYANAIAGTAINLTSVGAGAAHSLSNSLDLPTAVAVISPNGVLQRINITDSGSNYISAPTVTIGTAWSSTTAVTLGQQLSVATKLYTVTVAGTTGASSPTTTTFGEAVANGTATLQWVGYSATGTASLRYGYGYSGNPVISLVTTTGTGYSGVWQSTKSNAKLIPLLENGQLVGVQIDNPGIGYSTANITVSGDGTGCKTTPDISIGNINTLQANNELLTVPGTVNNVKVISGGYNYGVATVKVIGDGTGCTAVATTDGGKVTKITVTNQGTGYSYANVVISGNGFAASARAIISPSKGHGKDAFNELYTKTLMFYSNVSLDKNQGFDVNNDYRQVGILKNPKIYNTTNRFSEPIGSGCFTISATFNTSLFYRDMELTIPRTVDSNLQYKRYLIIATNTTGTSLLVTSLDGDTPQVGDTMTFSGVIGGVSGFTGTQFLSIAAFGSPTVDKYSGDMLFIDNKAGFTPSADETVTLRTIITF